MNTTRIIAIATVLAVAGAGQASAGGLLGGLGILNGNRTEGVVIAPNVGIGNNVLSDNNGNNILNGALNGTLAGVLNGNALGILGGGGDCGCKKRKY